MVKLSHSVASAGSSIAFGDTLITDNYLEYYVVTKLIFSANGIAISNKSRQWCNK